MRHFILAAGLLAFAATANAACYGTGAYRTCNDDNGNTYNVQKYGGTTQVQGSNPSTGSTWNQTSTTTGNTTVTNGTAANGNAWNSTTTASPGMVQQSGIDSNGQVFNRTCTRYGCN